MCIRDRNITDPALIEGIHGQYAAAGSRIVNANTFGASAHKLAGSAYTPVSYTHLDVYKRQPLCQSLHIHFHSIMFAILPVSQDHLQLS